MSFIHIIIAMILMSLLLFGGLVSIGTYAEYTYTCKDCKLDNNITIQVIEYKNKIIEIFNIFPNWVFNYFYPKYKLSGDIEVDKYLFLYISYFLYLTMGILTLGFLYLINKFFKTLIEK